MTSLVDKELWKGRVEGRGAGPPLRSCELRAPSRGPQAMSKHFGYDGIGP